MRTRHPRRRGLVPSVGQQAHLVHVALVARADAVLVRAGEHPGWKARLDVGDEEAVDSLGDVWYDLRGDVTEDGNVDEGDEELDPGEGLPNAAMASFDESGQGEPRDSIRFGYCTWYLQVVYSRLRQAMVGYGG